MSEPVIYLIGSLRNPQIPKISQSLREASCDVFDDWFSAGPAADDCWRDYEKQRGNSYSKALRGHPAKHVFTFDEFHLNRAHGAVLVYPAGKSGHIELGYVAGQHKPTFILLDEIPDRYDVMKQFASQGIFTSVEELKSTVQNYPWPKLPEMPTIHQHEVMWLAGLIEGDGCFCIGKGKTPRLSIQMTDQDVITKAAKMLESSVWTSGRLTKAGKTVWSCGASGLKAIEWMRILKPYMGIRRQGQIVKIVSSWLDKKTYNNKDKLFWASVFGLS